MSFLIRLAHSPASKSKVQAAGTVMKGEEVKLDSKNVDNLGIDFC